MALLLMLLLTQDFATMNKYPVIVQQLATSYRNMLPEKCGQVLHAGLKSGINNVFYPALALILDDTKDYYQCKLSNFIFEN